MHEYEDRWPHVTAGAVIAGGIYQAGGVRVTVRDGDKKATAIDFGGLAVIAGRDCSDAQFADVFEKALDELRRKIHHRDSNAVAVPHNAIETS